ncbi:MAG: hypothetical protein M3N19_11310 [Candidatus Eremiobacteraeota bacterium]|nr:hypothetical protein [Candidatus Eremiobacteraeota bacterium]
MKTVAILAIAMIFITSCSYSSRAIEYRTLQIPPWSRLHVGMKIFLGADSYKSQTQIICQSQSAYRITANVERSRCLHKDFGTPAQVTKIISSAPSDWYYPVPFVVLRAIDGSWSGVTTALELQPDIPPGAVIVLTRKEYPVALAPTQAFSAQGWGPDLGTDVRVKVLHYYPAAWDMRPLYVQVLEGRYRGNVGWIFMRDTQMEDSLNANGSGLDYSVQPELTTTF